MTARINESVQKSENQLGLTLEYFEILKDSVKKQKKKLKKLRAKLEALQARQSASAKPELFEVDIESLSQRIDVLGQAKAKKLNLFRELVERSVGAHIESIGPKKMKRRNRTSEKLAMHLIEFDSDFRGRQPPQLTASFVFHFLAPVRVRRGQQVPDQAGLVFEDDHPRVRGAADRIRKWRGPNARPLTATPTCSSPKPSTPSPFWAPSSTASTFYCKCSSPRESMSGTT